MADDDERPRPWHWPGGWVREEAFWRQITTATVSALSTGGIAFLAARFAGLFAQVPWSTVCKTLLAGTVLVPTLALIVLLIETGSSCRRSFSSPVSSLDPHPLRRPDQPFSGRQFTGGTKGAHTGWKYGGGSGPSQMSLSLVPPSLIGTLPRPDGVFQ
jgi:hypothetical protein